MGSQGLGGILPMVFIGGLAAALAPLPAGAAEDGIYLDDRSSIQEIIIRGEIHPGYAEFVEGLMRDLIDQGQNFSFRLIDSPGGSVEEALALGRMIRAMDATVWMEGDCYSSCGLVYVGGSLRVATGNARLGLHRPYFAVSEGGGALSSADVKRLYKDVGAYLEEMNITPKVMDAIMLTEPEDMHVLEGREIDAWIPMNDPVYDEVSTIRMARRYGISTTEYRRIDQMRFETECAQRADDFVCMMELREALFWRLPPDAAPGIEARVAAARQACQVAIEEASDPERKRAVRVKALQDRDPEPLRAYLNGVPPEWTSCMRERIRTETGHGQ